MPRNLSSAFFISIVAHVFVLAGMRIGGARQTFVSLPVSIMFRPGSAALPAPAAVPVASARPAPLPKPVVQKTKSKKKQVPEPIPAPQTLPAEALPEAISEQTAHPAADQAPVQTPSAQPAPAAAIPAPAGGGQVSFDTDRFPYSYYTTLLVRRIGRFWRWSAEFGRLKAVISFQIGRSGDVSSVAVASSSGDSVYDQQALRAVRLASPFPPLPAGYTEPSLGVYFTFTFTE